MSVRDETSASERSDSSLGLARSDATGATTDDDDPDDSASTSTVGSASQHRPRPSASRRHAGAAAAAAAGTAEPHAGWAPLSASFATADDNMSVRSIDADAGSSLAPTEPWTDDGDARFNEEQAGVGDDDDDDDDDDNGVRGDGADSDTNGGNGLRADHDDDDDEDGARLPLSFATLALETRFMEEMRERAELGLGLDDALLPGLDRPLPQHTLSAEPDSSEAVRLAELARLFRAAMDSGAATATSPSAVSPLLSLDSCSTPATAAAAAAIGSSADESAANDAEYSRRRAAEEDASDAALEAEYALQREQQRAQARTLLGATAYGTKHCPERFRAPFNSPGRYVKTDDTMPPLTVPGAADRESLLRRTCVLLSPDEGFVLACSDRAAEDSYAHIFEALASLACEDPDEPAPAPTADEPTPRQVLAAANRQDVIVAADVMSTLLMSMVPVLTDAELRTGLLHMLVSLARRGLVDGQRLRPLLAAHAPK